MPVTNSLTSPTTARTAHLGSSLRVGNHGGIVTHPQDEYVRHQIEMILFTNPGERPNRPTFGSGLLQFVFAPNSVELAATLQANLHATLERELRGLARVDEVDVSSVDSRLEILVSYLVLATGNAFERRFVR